MKIALCILCVMLLAAGHAMAAEAQQPMDASTPADAPSSWQSCQQLANDDAARLACFDHWARQQRQQALPVAKAPAAPTAPAGAPNTPATAAATATENGCRDHQYGTLSRFWELESGTDCGTFGFRGYRPLNVSLGMATHPPPAVATSPAPGRDGAALSYQAQDLRIGLSLRTKLAQGLLTGSDPAKRDSLWFGYTQQSTWQVFNGALSRPFRTTDHEPEFMYAYPADLQLPGGWRMRYAGLGLSHQSNGQALPLSRSWNRVYLMAGADLDDRYIITARIWNRIAEGNSTSTDPSKDDNPDIEDTIGRAEIKGAWNFDRNNQLGVTVRNNLRASGKGSIRLEWLKAIGDPAHSNLRLHAQLFHGYGDTLLDYNVKRTVFMLGLSLVDF
jgi:phospholipase A1